MVVDGELALELEQAVDWELQEHQEQIIHEDIAANSLL